MFGLFGFEAKNFTDDELSDRVTELSRRILWATRMGHYDMAQQFRNQKLMCEQEQRDRIFAPRFQNMIQSSPVVVETDPDLAKAARLEQEAKAERDAPKKGPRAKPFTITKERIRPSISPTSDD
jgi:hypothetical protein